MDAGGISQIAGDAGGYLYGLNTTTLQVFEHDSGSAWHIDGVNVNQMTSDGAGTMYAADATTKTVFQHDTGSSWHAVGGGADVLFTNKLGNLYAVNNSSGVLYLHTAGANWTPVPMPVPNWTVVQGNQNGLLFYVYAGQKHVIAPNVWQELGSPNSTIVTLPQTTVDQIMLGSPFLLPS